jgi:hypothetical protein
MKKSLYQLIGLERTNFMSCWSIIRHNENLKIALAIFISSQIFELLLIKLSGGQFSFLCSWDCTWYKEIATHGYDASPFRHERQDAANWAFFPALPFLVFLLNLITGISHNLSILIISKVFFLISIFLFIIFCKRYNPKLPAILCGAIVAFNPYSLYGNAGYNEPIFLSLTCAFFIFLKDKKYLYAGLIGAPLTAVRFVAISAVFSYLAGARNDFFIAKPPQRVSMALGLLLIPLGLCLFVLFLYFKTGDGLAFIHIQKAWGHILMNPLAHLVGTSQGTRFQQYLGLITLLGLFGVVWMTMKRRPELSIFLFICIVLPLSTGLTSMPRYLFWQAPFLFFMAEVLNLKKLWIFIFPSMIAGLTFMYLAWLRGDIFAASGAAFVR